MIKSPSRKCPFSAYAKFNLFIDQDVLRLDACLYLSRAFSIDYVFTSLIRLEAIPLSPALTTVAGSESSLKVNNQIDDSNQFKVELATNPSRPVSQNSASAKRSSGNHLVVWAKESPLNSRRVVM
jgi:hypothetical protein